MESSSKKSLLQQLAEQFGGNVSEAAAQLREWQELQTIVDSSSCGAYKASPEEEFPILYANEGYYEIHGYTKQQFEEDLGNKAGSLLLPQDKKRITREIEDSIARGDSKIILEYRVRRRDGAVVWLRSEINFTTDANGERRIMGMVLDITQQKELELRLLRTSTLFQVAQKHSRLNMWELDIKNRRILQTEQSKALHGYDDVVENVPDSLFASGYFHPDTADEVRKLFDRIYRGEEHPSATYKAKKKDSEDGYWWEKVTYELVRDEDGNAAYAIGISEDVTDQKERELRQDKNDALYQILNEDLLLTMQLDLTDGIVLDTWFSEQVPPIQEANKLNFDRVFQYFLDTIANPDDAKRFRSQFALPQIKKYIAAHQEVPTFECRRKAADGHIAWARLVLRATELQGNGHQILTLYARDITNQIQREQRLQQKAERDEESGLYNFSTGKLLIQNILSSQAVSNRNSSLALIKIDGLSLIKCGQARKEWMTSITAQIMVWMPTSCILARDGEDTFLLFCYGLHSAMERAAILDRVIKEATQPQALLPEGVSLQAYVGLTSQIGPNVNFEHIYQSASNLLAQAQRNGAPCTVTDAEDNTASSSEQQGWNVEKFVEEGWRSFERGTPPDELTKTAFDHLGRTAQAQRITLFLRLPDDRQLKKQLEWRCRESGASLTDLDSAALGELLLSISKYQSIITIDPGSGELYDRFCRCCQGAPIPPVMVCSGWEKGTVTFCTLIEGAEQTPSLHEVESVVSFLRRLYFVNELRIHYKYAALRDPVTSLFNFEGYRQRLQSIREDTLASMGMASVYIVNFKEYNQRFSRHQGNVILQSVAQIIEDVFGANACYRTSGATFTILCPDITHEAFTKLFHKLEAAIDLKHHGRVACASVWEQNGISLDAMEQQLDERLQVAANHLRMGRKMTAEQSAHTILEGVKDKINHGNFVAFLQPKASAATGKVCGAEALIRYQDEKKAILPPSEFLKTIEAAGAIREIDLFVLDSVCRIMRRWLDEGWEGFPISLNYSRATILEPDILEATNRIVERYHVPKELVEIEITETISSTDSMGLQDIVHRFAQSGYRLAIDDFGADYSNIYVLYLLDIHTLKFDRKIINDVYHNDRARAVVQNLLLLCRQMNITSVAEGVQSREQMETLREMSCDLIQGYYLNKPIPAEEFRRLYIRTDLLAEIHTDTTADNAVLPKL